MNFSRNLILVGGSQLGKSSFGNFLLNGRTFPVGDGSSSETKEIQSKEIDHLIVNENGEKVYRVRIIDTPGIGDSDEESTVNIMKLYNSLEEMKKNNEIVSCVCLVASCQKMIDEEFRRNVRFYKRIFREIFERNLAIIITNYDCNPIALMKMKMTGNDPEEIISEIKESVIEELGDLSSESFPCFTVDSYCQNVEEDIDNWENSQSTREEVLNRTCLFKGTPIGRLTFPKTEEMLKEDSLKISFLEGEIEELMNRKISSRKELEDVSTILLREIKGIKESSHAFDKVKEELERKDTDEPYRIHVITISSYKSKKLLIKPKAKFLYRAKYPITSYESTGSGKVIISKDSKKDTHTIGGKVEWGVFHTKNKQTSVFLYTDMRIRFCDEIEKLKVDMQEEEMRVNVGKERIAKLVNEKKNLSSDMMELEQLFDEKCSVIQVLRFEYCDFKVVKNYECVRKFTSKKKSKK